MFILLFLFTLFSHFIIQISFFCVSHSKCFAFFFINYQTITFFKREVPQLWGEMNDEEEKKWNWWTKERREKMTRFVVSSLNMLIISSFRISLSQAHNQLILHSHAWMFAIRQTRCVYFYQRDHFLMRMVGSETAVSVVFVQFFFFLLFLFSLCVFHCLGMVFKWNSWCV